MLAIGTQKGNLLFYHHQEKVNSQNTNSDDKIENIEKDDLVSESFQRKNISTTIRGKHPTKIQCGAWNSHTSHLILGSQDGSFTKSNIEGDTIDQIDLKKEPLQMCFSKQSRKSTKSDKLHHESAEIAINIGGKSIMLLYPNKDPVEIDFQKEFGKIMTHAFIENGYLLVGFQSGWVKLLSLSYERKYKEKWSCHVHSKSLYQVKYVPSLKKCAITGRFSYIGLSCTCLLSRS